MAEAGREQPALGAAGRLASVPTFRSLSSPNFRLIWASVICIGTAFAMEQVALSWYILQATNSPLLVGAIQGVRMGPFLVFGPLGGVLADRFDRQRLLAIFGALSALSVLALGSLIATGHARLWEVFLLTLFTWSAFALSIPARQSLIPTLVSREQMMNAVALQVTAFQLTSVIGPLIAGLLISALNPGAVLLLSAGCLGLVVFLVSGIQAPRLPARPSERILTNIAQGLSYAYREPLVRSVLILAFFAIVFSVPVGVLLPTYARDLFRIGPTGLGYLSAILGVGASIAALSVASLGSASRRGLLLLGAALLLGLSLLLFGLTPWLPAGLAFACVFLALVGAGQAAFFALQDSTVQLTVPDHMRGRVMSVVGLNFGLAPLGNILAGALAKQGGAPLATWTLGAIVSAAALLAFAFLPRLRRL